MAIVAWDETAPAGASKIRLGDDEIRNTKEQIRRRQNQGGHIWNTGVLAEEGRHAIDAGGAGVGPHLYESDGSTLIVEYKTNILAEIASSTWKLQSASGETKNLHPSIMQDDLITIDAKGYKRHLQELRVDESDPIDTLVNIAAGMFHGTFQTSIEYYAGGTLTIGAGDLVLPAAGNHAYYLIYLDTAGTLQADKGAEVLLASTPVIPDIPIGVSALAVIDILDTSVNFSLATSGANAFLILDLRHLVSARTQAIRQVGQATVGSYSASGAPIVATKTITTTGGLVLVAGAFKADRSSPAILSLERVGSPNVPIAQTWAIDNGAGDSRGSLVGFDSPALGAVTYELRTSSSVLQVARLWVAELDPLVFV